MTLEFSQKFSKNTHISNFIKIRWVGAQFFHADRRTDRHDEANNSFLQFYERAKKWGTTCSATDNRHILHT